VIGPRLTKGRNAGDGGHDAGRRRNHRTTKLHGAYRRSRHVVQTSWLVHREISFRVLGGSGRTLHGWTTTAVNVKLLLPPRQSRGTSYGRLGQGSRPNSDAQGPVLSARAVQGDRSLWGRRADRALLWWSHCALRRDFDWFGARADGQLDLATQTHQPGTEHRQLGPKPNLRPQRTQGQRWPKPTGS
jgi:hypothetical protein